MAIDGPTHGLRIVAPKNGVGGKNTSSNTPGRAALNELINEIGYSNVVKNTVQDWMDSLNAIRKKTGFAFKKIGYFGLSEYILYIYSLVYIYTHTYTYKKDISSLTYISFICTFYFTISSRYGIDVWYTIMCRVTKT